MYLVLFLRKPESSLEETVFRYRSLVEKGSRDKLFIGMVAEYGIGRKSSLRGAVPADRVLGDSRGG